MKGFLVFFGSFLCLAELFSGVCAVRINSAEELIRLFNETTGKTVHENIELTEDLDFSHVDLTYPLGASHDKTCISYSGLLRGNSHSIRGISMNNRGKIGYDSAGLFCSLENASVENLVIDSSCSFNGFTSGALSVTVRGSLAVINVTNKGTVIGCEKVGGFFGVVGNVQQGFPVVSLKNCVNEANVTGVDYVGGILGRIENNANMVLSLSRCTSSGNVTSSDLGVGGLIGFFLNNTNMTVSISDSMSDGTVSGNRFRVGGIIGSIDENVEMNLVISNTTCNGIVTGNYGRLGGFIGYVYNNNHASITIENSANNAQLSTSKEKVGGFVGYIGWSHSLPTSMTITNCTNNGVVSGDGHTSGFIGFVAKGVSMVISNSINNGAVNSSLNYVGGFVGCCDAGSNITLLNDTNLGSITGDYGNLAGLVGYVSAYTGSGSLFLTILNCANKANILARGGIGCGLFCASPLYHSNIVSNVANSINKGTVKASEHAYGVTNAVTVARNIVSMGDVIGSVDSSTFWSESKQVELFYGLKVNCKNCSAHATLFEKNTATGLYDVVTNNKHVHDLLNHVASREHLWSFWSAQLDFMDHPLPYSSSSSSSYSSSESKQSQSSEASSFVLSSFIFIMTSIFYFMSI